MRLLRRVRIKDFRSLPEVVLEDIGDIAPLVGANGSGKSNVFRALNLFFNDAIEEGETLELSRDVREPGRGKKFQITVEVDLAFGGFKIRAEYQDALNRLAGGGSDITIRKVFALDELTKRPRAQLFAGKPGAEPAPVAEADRTLVERLLGAITFRYVPNHQHPSTLLEHEEQNIRTMLFSRVGAGKGFDP